jgi:RNA polymerase sigma-70 factor (ECF subfamily)
MDEHSQRFRRLIEPLHDRALAFARCVCRSTTEGDDLFQEAMLLAFGKLDGLRDDGAFCPWLYRILINAHRTRCRRAFWRRLIPLGPRGEADDDDARSADPASGEPDYRTAGATAHAVEASRRIRQALARIPPVQREAIVLFEIEGWQVEDIAELQRVSVSAVKSRLSRGRKHLRLLYDPPPTVAGPPSKTLTTRGTP